MEAEAEEPPPLIILPLIPLRLRHRPDPSPSNNSLLPPYLFLPRRTRLSRPLEWTLKAGGRASRERRPRTPSSITSKAKVVIPSLTFRHPLPSGQCLFFTRMWSAQPSTPVSVVSWVAPRMPSTSKAHSWQVPARELGLEQELLWGSSQTTRAPLHPPSSPVFLAHRSHLSSVVRIRTSKLSMPQILPIEASSAFL